MAFFDDVYEKLFPKKARGLILHEVLKRNSSYQNQYGLWKDSDMSSELLDDIGVSLKLKKQGIAKLPEVHEFNGSYSNGIAITYDPDIDKDHFYFLFDLFSEKVQELGYKVSVSDLMVTEKPRYIESKEKHYLKTRTSQTTPIDQKFGNILIELISIDDQPSFIRLMAHAYNDRLYKSPENFEILAKYLFPSSQD